MAQQLSDGVRGLMLDIHERDGAVLMCHGTCEIGSKPLKDGLRDVVAFLETNKNAVVTIFMEDYAKDREKLAQQFVDVPGLLDLVFNPAAQEVMSKGWPRLSEMRAKNKRLLIFSDHGDLTRAGVVGSRPWTVENYWSLGHDGRNWDCYSRWDGTPLTHREPSFSPLFVMNQFRSIPESLNAPFDNGDKLVDRAVNFCGPAARKMPNYVSIDFYELGDNLRAVDTINRYRYVERAETLAPSVPSSALLTSENRRGALPGLPDWSGAGYRGGGPLPGNQQISADAACRVTPEELDRAYGVRPNDSADDSAGLQRAIDDIRADCSGTAGFDRNSLISLPAGRIDISKQISVDASHLVIRGQGSDPAGGTRIVFRPDADTRYDTLTADGSRWDQDTMTAGTAPDQAKGGWVWPGRGLFRVQTREVAPRYADDWKAAPANRKDLYEGSVNQHWASGMKLRGSTADPGYAAKEGGRVVPLDPKASIALFQPGQHVWVGAANSRKFYELQTATATDRYENLHMRQQVFRVASVDTAQRTVTLDKPLEFDLPVDSTSDGSAPIGDSAYPSKVMPLKMVVGVGFENFSFTQDMTGVPAAGGGTHHLNPAQAKNNYGNLAPEYALHGLVFKWAADSWARGVRADMTGSHPIVTEVAKNLQFEGNHLDGAWNKGKGGNGYFRGSRVWDSLYAQNTTRNLRHFTFQWSASNNVVYGNDFDSDLNLHGGWERRNLFENNTVRVPYEHRSGHCTARCGGEGGDTESGTWYPIWWAAGEKAVKWAGASGPQNVFHRNVLAKQLTPGGPYVDYLPYGKPGTGPQPVYQFGSGAADPGTFRHLTRGGKPIADWNGHELADYLTGDAGVNASRTEAGPSLFLKSVP
ncbi:conserved hypothetical protein [Streptomyces clavuligerus]|nr:conserved hypothetical protein [Streptomyces clavuligerus]